MKGFDLIFKKLPVILACMAGFWLAALPAPSLAKDPVTVQITVIMSGPPAKTLPAGDDENHLIGIGQRKGRAVFSDGRKARYSNVFIMDVFRGKFATSWGYTKMAFDENNWIFFKWNASYVGRDEKGSPKFAGTGELQKGVGTYKGIKGAVKFTNRQVAPCKELPTGGTEAKAELTYTLP